MSVETICLYPEWAPQEAIWVGWPCVADYWGAAFEGAREEVAAFVRMLAPRVQVYLGVRAQSDALEARAACGPDCDIHILPMGDIWFRDTGPIFVDANGVPTGLLFRFNGWGGKYLMPGDEATGAAMLRLNGCAARVHDFVLEGGAVDCDGAGRMLTTRACLLNANRNGWTEMEAEHALKAAFGIHQLFWLDDGLAADHTDGHIDNVARFIGPNHVVCHRPSGDDDPNARFYATVQTRLEQHGLRVHSIPSPGRIQNADGELMAASYLNFVFANGLIILPRYEPVYSEQARLALAKALPDYEIVALDAHNILTGGGSFHCISQQIPKGRESSAQDQQ